MIDKLKSYFKYHTISAVILATIIFLAIILVITALNIYPTSDVEILIAPASATVTIDGKTYENGTYRLPRGEVSVHIEKDGFITQDFTFNTTSNKLYTFLLQTDGTYSWYDEHPEDSIIMTTIGDYNATLLSNSYNDKYPIISSLPIIYAHYDEDYNYTEFRIDGGSFPGCTSDFCLKVTDTTGGNLDYAKKLIKDAGFDPADYEILYQYSPIIPLE